MKAKLQLASVKGIIILIILKCVSANLDFQTIDEGYYSGIRTKMNRVYRTHQGFSNMWARHSSTVRPEPPLPSMNFDDNWVVACVFRGSFRTGGYGVKITAVDEVDNAIVVKYKTYDPNARDITTMAFTQPYEMIKINIPVRGMEVQFEIEVETAASLRNGKRRDHRGRLSFSGSDRT